MTSNLALAMFVVVVTVGSGVISGECRKFSVSVDHLELTAFSFLVLLYFVKNLAHGVTVWFDVGLDYFL